MRICGSIFIVLKIFYWVCLSLLAFVSFLENVCRLLDLIRVLWAPLQISSRVISHSWTNFYHNNNCFEDVGEICRVKLQPNLGILSTVYIKVLIVVNMRFLFLFLLLKLVNPIWCTIYGVSFQNPELLQIFSIYFSFHFAYCT